MDEQHDEPRDADPQNTPLMGSKSLSYHGTFYSSMHAWRNKMAMAMVIQAVTMLLSVHGLFPGVSVHIHITLLNK